MTATSMTRDEAISKARKLLALSKSSNEGEAANAAAKAQELIDRYELETAALSYEGTVEPEEEIRDFADDPIDQKIGPSKAWKTTLAMGVAKANQTKVYLMGSQICLVGTPSDVAATRYLYSWLARQVVEISQRECKGNGFVYANNYRLGMATRLSERLAEQRKATVAQVQADAARSENQNALVLVGRAIAKRDERSQAVQLWAKKNMRLRAGNASRISGSESARARGYRDGNRVAFTTPRGSLEG